VIQLAILPTCFFGANIRRQAIGPGHQGKGSEFSLEASPQEISPPPIKPIWRRSSPVALDWGQPDAEKRVADVFDQAKSAMTQAADKAKEAADAARKTGVFGRSFRCWSEHSLLAIWRPSADTPAMNRPGSSDQNERLGAEKIGLTIFACSRKHQIFVVCYEDGLRIASSFLFNALSHEAGGVHV
jgi:hypothetical protein